jgi:demethylmenaquinone methyltransferase/2-methoxy-6-polyprenyl-1,4-benzoquinol methylase
MVATLGATPGWRVLDVATGTGLVARELRRQYGCRVVGLDQSEAMLSRARPLIGSVYEQVVRGEAEGLPFGDGEFDALTFTYLLRYVDDPEATLRELARVVRPEGRIAMLEFHVPPRPLLYPAWWLYTRVGLPALGRLVSRDWYEVGRFLGPSIEDYWRRHPLDDVPRMWARAGMVDVRVRKMSLGGGVVISGVRAHRRP